MRSSGEAAGLLIAIALGALAIGVAAQDADGVYADLLARERELRLALELAPQRRARPPGEASAAVLRRVRSLAADYEQVARAHARHDRADDALWQAAVLAADAFWQFGDVRDRASAVRLFERLAAQYPSSPLRARTRDHLARLNGSTAPPGARLLAVRQDVLRDLVRVTLELDGETAFRAQRTSGPARLLLELPGARAADALGGATIAFTDGAVPQARVAAPTESALRVELDIDEAARPAIYALDHPHRIVIDLERRGAAAAGTAASRRAAAVEDASALLAVTGSARLLPASSPAVPTGRAPPSRPAPGVSLSRQLGLGLGRIVLDPGHGGHDPGARVRGLHEAEIVLDVALRLETLLRDEHGVEVILTRRTNQYVSLEDRTATANRAGADLFLSIHVNASADSDARGLETYFLNFAPNPAAEATAARENTGSSRTLANLPDIVRAIALNDRVGESRRFAGSMQSALYSHVRRTHPQTRDLGVKQAPFMVLVGATMPSALVEISFLTHAQEGALLRTPGYRQQIAEALFIGIVQYQTSLRTAPLEM